MNNPARIEIKTNYIKLLSTVSVMAALFTPFIGYFLFDLCKQFGAAQKFPIFFAGWCLFVIVSMYGPVLWQALTIRGAVVTISEEGICDRRVSDALIPWSAVQKLVCKGLPYIKFALVYVAPDVARTIPKKLIWALGYGGLFGRSRYRITMLGLDQNEPEILAQIEGYWSHYGKSRQAVSS